MSLRICPTAWWLFAVALVATQYLDSATPAVAKPIPLPLPLIMADYTPRPFPANRSMAFFSRHDSDLGLSSWSSVNATSDTGFELSRRDSMTGLLSSVEAMNGNADELKTLAAQSGSVDDDDYDYQRNCAAALTSFSQNMEGFQQNFATESASTSDKGHGHYTKNEVLEDMLKKLYNTNKDLLESVTIIVSGVPVVGPILGPIMYQIKCIIIAIQDGLEDATDGTLNGIENILKPFLRTCPASEILDICLG
ncbi:hypothetical protein CPB83DRAFT_857833 [Crepidotus variabilis]|uniref:Uncharacterized protein n=1 Tax=Crepidotus variabilis TaxID=179855 RepID=A0A9P6ECT8_9AGAR|nr:hypothetical protein CPB83DRAFT_857833 [Crepidotus variabilis]